MKQCAKIVVGLPQIRVLHQLLKLKSRESTDFPFPFSAVRSAATKYQASPTQVGQEAQERLHRAGGAISLRIFFMHDA